VLELVREQFLSLLVVEQVNTCKHQVVQLTGEPLAKDIT